MKLKDKFKNFALLELIVGLIIGLFFALLVALYISKLPTEFLRSNADSISNNKVEITDDWNPNNSIAKLETTIQEQDHVNDTQDNNSNVIEQPNDDLKTINPATLPNKPTEDVIGKILQQITPLESTSVETANSNSGDLINTILNNKAKTSTQNTNTNDSSIPKNTTEEPMNNNYVVQVGAFRSKEQAEKLAKQLQTSIVKLTIVEGTFDNATIYRVRTANTNYNEALNINKALNNAGVSANIIKIN